MSACDFSFPPHPSIAALHAAGITAVGRYVGPAVWGKTITQAEANSYYTASPRIDVWLVFEDTATDYTGGRAAGRLNAQKALDNLPALYPQSQFIYFAVDTEIAAGTESSVKPYFLGINDVLDSSQVGLYGQGSVSDYLFNAGLISHFWESASTSFPGNGSLNKHANIWQKVGAPLPNTDPDVLYARDYGQFPKPGVRPPPPPPPPPGPSIEAFIDEVVAQLGVPYVFGGDNPGPGPSPPNGGFDCSGLLYYCALKVGFDSVPRTSEEQFGALPSITNPQQGDFVFFNTHDGQTPPSHVGMVWSGANSSGTAGTMIDAPFTGTVVRYDSIPAVGGFMGYRRLPGGVPVGGGGAGSWLGGVNA